MFTNLAYPFRRRIPCKWCMNTWIDGNSTNRVIHLCFLGWCFLHFVCPTEFPIVCLPGIRQLAVAGNLVCASRSCRPLVLLALCFEMQWPKWTLIQLGNEGLVMLVR